MGLLKTKGALGIIIYREDGDIFHCLICRLVLEDTFYLQIGCSVACIAWRESVWAFEMDSLHLNNAAELINIILNVDRVLNIHNSAMKAFALNAAIIMDVICMLAIC